MTNIIAKSWGWQGKGEPESLVLKEKEIRELADNEVLIQNTYIGLNPVDWKLIQNGPPAWEENHIPGVDGVGIILKTGKKMSHLPIGAKVCYHTDLTQNGSFSTHTIVLGNRIIYVPNKVSDAVAAAFPCPSLTAWQAFQKLPIITNKNVLVSGAGGSVGYILTQILINQGARVYVTASTKHHEEFLKMGVVKAVDYKTEGWKDIMKESLHGNLFDAVIDTVNSANATNLTSLVGYYGHIVSIQGRIAQNPLPGFTTCISLHEIALGAFHQYATEQQIAQLMTDGEKLLNRIGNGRLKQRELSVESFDKLPQHLQKMKEANTEIKYVVKI